MEANVNQQPEIDNETIANRIIAAFGEGEGPLNGGDLVKAAGVPRKQYLKALGLLTEATHELVELEKDIDFDDEDEAVLYLKPKSRRQTEPTGSHS